MTDGTSDLGRISRQQDFLRRTVDRLLDEGRVRPGVASALIETVSRVHRRPTRPHRRQDARVRRRDEQGRPDGDHDVPDRVTRTRRSRATPCSSPTLEGDNMQAILAVFRGEATLDRRPRPGLRPPRRSAPTDDHDRRPGADDHRRVTGPSTTATDDDRPRRGRRRPRRRCPRVIAEENVIGVAPTRTPSANDLARRRRRVSADGGIDLTAHTVASAERSDGLASEVEGAGEAGGGVGRAGHGGAPGRRCGGPAPAPRRRRTRARRSPARRAATPRRPRRPARWPGSPTAAP